VSLSSGAADASSCDPGQSELDASGW